VLFTVDKLYLPPFLFSLCFCWEEFFPAITGAFYGDYFLLFLFFSLSGEKVHSLDIRTDAGFGGFHSGFEGVVSYDGDLPPRIGRHPPVPSFREIHIRILFLARSILPSSRVRSFPTFFVPLTVALPREVDPPFLLPVTDFFFLSFFVFCFFWCFYSIPSSFFSRARVSAVPFFFSLGLSPFDILPQVYTAVSSPFFFSIGVE